MTQNPADDPVNALARLYNTSPEAALAGLSQQRRVIYNVYPDWPDEEIRKTVKCAYGAAQNEPGTEVILRYAPGEYPQGPAMTDGARLIVGDEDGLDLSITCYSGKTAVAYEGKSDPVQEWHLD